jgi:predicted metal-dependent hydrolase
MSTRRFDPTVDSGLWTVDCNDVMSHKSARIAALYKPFEGRSLDARYLGYFECFNQQLFFEAHEVLEELWLPQRRSPESAFYKGLIQLAGAFVHVQKGRPGPALALFRLAQTNLQKFPALHEGLDLGIVLALIEHWMGKLASSGREGALSASTLLRLPLPDEQMQGSGSAI